MKNVFRRTTGAILIFTAVICLVVSIFFLVQIWRLRQPVTTSLESNLGLLYETSITTNNGLTLVENTLGNLINTTVTLDETTVAIAQSIHDTGLLADTTADLVGENLQTTIRDAQTALDSAQTSAAVIDDVLSALASIPFIGLEYNPEVPLAQALGQVSTSLDTLPPALENIQGDLESAQTNLLQVESNLININQDIQDITNSLTQAQNVIDDYQVEVGELQTRLERARSSAGDWVQTTAWWLSFGVVWLAIMQVGMLVQGFELFISHSNFPQIPAKKPIEIAQNTADKPAQKPAVPRAKEPDTQPKKPQP